VAGGVEAVADDETITEILLNWHVSLVNLEEFLLDWAKDIEGDLDFSLWVLALNGCADNGNVVVLLADAVDT